MDVIDYQLGFWFLLKQDDDLFLDVNFSYSPSGYSMLIKFCDLDKWAYDKEGSHYAARVARDVQKQGLSKYKDRNVHNEYKNEVAHAIRVWRN